MPTVDAIIRALPATADDVDSQVRNVLRPLFRRANSATTSTPVASDPNTCPNCGAPCDSQRSPYCSPRCRETSALIRRIRAAISDGSILDPERQANLGENLWKLQGGGFPRRQTLVDPKAVQKIIARDGGRCTICGAPATEVHHTEAALSRGSG